MKTFKLSEYKEAQNYAIDLSNQCNRDCGIAKTKEFNSTVFNVFLLPNKENRRGFELTCEVVIPNTPKSV